jgi:hypothetical protein
VRILPALRFMIRNYFEAQLHLAQRIDGGEIDNPLAALVERSLR